MKTRRNIITYRCLEKDKRELLSSSTEPDEGTTADRLIVAEGVPHIDVRCEMKEIETLYRKFRTHRCIIDSHLKYSFLLF